MCFERLKLRGNRIDFDLRKRHHVGIFRLLENGLGLFKLPAQFTMLTEGRDDRLELRPLLGQLGDPLVILTGLRHTALKAEEAIFNSLKLLKHIHHT